MAQISTANFNTLADSLSQQIQLWINTKGLGTASNTVSLGTSNNKSTVQGLNDIQMESYLALAFNALYNNVQQVFPGNIAVLYYDAVNALRNEVGGNFNSFLSNASDRVHPNFALLAPDILAANIFPAPSANVATYQVTGSATGTFTHGSALNSNATGAGNMSVKANSTIGAASNILTLTLTTLSGGTSTQTVTVPAATVNGTLFSIPGGQYLDCTNITCSAGTNNDAFAVVVVPDRIIAL